MVILEAKKLSRHFGGLKAVSQLDFQINRGEIFGMIGPNGSGKTTVFNVLTGVYRPTSGEVTFNGKSIGGLPPYEITRCRMARTFQNIRLFSNATVLENVQTGMHCRLQSNLLDALLRNRRYRDSERRSREKAEELLAFLGLLPRKSELAGNLPYGEQRRVELARALASDPEIILLDEPTAGMNPQEASTMMGWIKKIRESGVTVFLIEHNMKVLMGVSDRVIALDAGQKIAEGLPLEVSRHPAVVKAYLGSED